MVYSDLALEAVRIPAAREKDNHSSPWRLVLVRQGEVSYHVDSTAHTVRRCEGLLVPAGVHGALRWGHRDAVAGVCVRFWPEDFGGLPMLADRLLFQRAVGRPQCVRVLKAGHPLLEHFDDFTRSPSTARHLKPCHLSGLIKPLVTELRDSLPDASEAAGQALSRMVAILDREVMTEADLQRLSVSDLARKCECTRRHLSRLAQDWFGCPILALKTRLRLDRAAMLLRNPDTKIISVAHECGFNHLGSFTGKFRRRFGATPAQWRKKTFATERPGPDTIRQVTWTTLATDVDRKTGSRDARRRSTPSLPSAGPDRPISRTGRGANPFDSVPKRIRRQPDRRPVMNALRVPHGWSPKTV